MTIAVIENGVVTNKIIVQSLAHGQSLLPHATVVEDSTNRFSKGDVYTS
jgi:hypothetical protein